MHNLDPLLPVLLALVLILVAAKLGAYVAVKLGQPIVLGELVAGLVLGNVYIFDFIKTNEQIALIAALGLVILLFEVGLETNIKDMKAVGLESLAVAFVGVVLPFVFGYYVSGFLIAELSELARIFIGATLTATSVGITARVFKDLGVLQHKEARIVLGAAVIDDVLGLIILAVVAQLAQGAALTLESVGLIAVKAVFFIMAALLLGRTFVNFSFKLGAKIQIPGTMLVLALAFCFLMSYLASLAGLAPIVGAFAAGLLLDEVHFVAFKSERKIEDLIRPISYIFVPVFFVLTGMHVNLTVFSYPGLWIFVFALFALAVIGKVLSAWSFLSSQSVSRLLIGFGMIPRGEVGLIFASVGRAAGLLDDRLYAAIVVVVMLTTFVTPPLLVSVITKKQAA